MDDSALWVAALGIGAVGFMLLALAGMIAMYLNAKPPSAKDRASTETPQPEARHKPARKRDPSQAKVQASTNESPPTEDAASASGAQSGSTSSRARHKTVGGFWAWIKAWIFASIHAGTVSIVLGGITFFEDLANASEEIQHTGTVSFPKQLLPGTLSGSTSRERLSQPSGGLLRDGHYRGGNQRDDQPEESNEDPIASGEIDPPVEDPPGAADWEVVDLVNEISADQTSD